MRVRSPSSATMGYRPGERHAAQPCKGLDHGRQWPGLDRFRPCLRQALKPFGVRMDRAHLGLEDDGLRGGGADHFGSATGVGRAPGGPSRITDIVA